MIQLFCAGHLFALLSKSAMGATIDLHVQKHGADGLSYVSVHVLEVTKQFFASRPESSVRRAPACIS